jgi:hypothetical protein
MKLTIGQNLRRLEPRGPELQRLREGHRRRDLLLPASHRDGARQGSEDVDARLFVAG